MIHPATGWIKPMAREPCLANRRDFSPRFTYRKPSTASAILGHAWRANSLVSEIRSQNANAGFYEIFPAAWFWLCDFDEKVAWKGKPSAANTAPH